MKGNVYIDVPAATAAEEPATRSYTDALGRTVEIPAQPERIIAHYFGSETVALGLPVVGTNYINAAAVLTGEQLKGIVDVGGDGVNLNLEKVLELKPDIILVPDFAETEAIDQLTKIAPTVAVPYGGDIFKHLETIGDIAGNKDAAAQWTASYTAKADEKRKELESVVKPGETASAFILYQDKQLYLYSPNYFGQTMHKALALGVPDNVQKLFSDKPDSLWESGSMELLPDYAADYVFLLVPGDNEDAKKAADDMLASSLWKNLPAVKNGKAFVVDSKWGFTDPMTMNWLLDEMTTTIEGK